MCKPQVIKSLNGDVCHPCIGAVIITDGQILMIERKNFPPGWACIAGHIDDTDDNPVDALIREVSEESGLDVTNHELLFEEEINNPCSRGVEYHYWYVYKCEVEGNIIKNESETKDIRWIDMDKITNLHLEEVWKYIFKKIEIL